MPLKRIIRDVSILALLCGTFYISTVAIRHLEANDASSEDSFSTARLKADRLELTENWAAAAMNYAQMAELDPYNGYAWHKLARCQDRLRFEFRHKIDQSPTRDPSSRLIQTLQTRFRQHETAAIAAFEKSSEFLRYRPESLRDLAAIHAERNEFETSLKYLALFVNEGNWTIHGLGGISRLGTGGSGKAAPGEEIDAETRLHQFPEFWKLERREYRLRKKNLSPRLMYREFLAREL